MVYILHRLVQAGGADEVEGVVAEVVAEAKQTPAGGHLAGDHEREAGVGTVKRRPLSYPSPPTSHPKPN